MSCQTTTMLGTVKLLTPTLVLLVCALALPVAQTIPNGCATACLWLGELSEHGLGVNPMTAPLDPWEEAAAWYGQGAALGDLKCAHALAYCYQHGLGEFSK